MDRVMASPNADRGRCGGPGNMQWAAVDTDHQCALMIGVDSGPLHVAGATTTPTIGVWTRHHPIHFFDLANNVLHLVPGDHEKYAPGPDAIDYFTKYYRH